MFAALLFAAALTLAIFVCRNPFSPAPFSAKISTLAVLKVFHRLPCQGLNTLRSAVLFGERGRRGSASAGARPPSLGETPRSSPPGRLGRAVLHKPCCPVSRATFQERWQQQNWALASRTPQSSRLEQPARGCPLTARGASPRRFQGALII